MQVHPDARSYRVKTVPGFIKLCVIFGEELSDGRYSRLARDVDPVGESPVLMTSTFLLLCLLHSSRIVGSW